MYWLTELSFQYSCSIQSKKLAKELTQSTFYGSVKVDFWIISFGICILRIYYFVSIQQHMNTLIYF
ncbi:unnamed protein product [Paramecium octaurelia]|uniref:Uncharacterized protein n=1 Tax=Paramecium octaurelia TaxID=43137 RepID=A0A8S1ULI6_PAROT|nr:unnamed protein product [Paramecium octaurelia]